MATIVSLGSALQDIYLIDHDDLTPTVIGDEAIFGKVLVGSKVDIESDMILPTSDGITYIRLLLPIDAAFYNRRNIKFNDIHNLLSTKELDYQHYHFSGRKWSYGKYKTHDLLKEYGLLKIQ